MTCTSCVTLNRDSGIYHRARDCSGYDDEHTYPLRAVGFTCAVDVLDRQHDSCDE